MATREVVYAHTAQAWTVGQLRQALEGIADHVLVEVSTLEDPSSSPSKPVLEANRQVITGTDFESEDHRTLLILCDWPTGDDYIHYQQGW